MIYEFRVLCDYITLYVFGRELKQPRQISLSFDYFNTRLINAKKSIKIDLVNQQQSISK